MKCMIVKEVFFLQEKYIAIKKKDEYIIFRDAFLLGYRCNCTDKNDLIPDIILDVYGSKIHKLQ